jgi:hypothetical protein
MFVDIALNEFLRNIVIKIESDAGSGTGFVYRNRDGVALIATAAHVVKEAADVGLPLTLWNERNLPPITLQKSERSISVNFSPSTGDAAIISIKPEILRNFSKDDVPIFGWDRVLRTGEQVGWVGFPTTHKDTLCFFSGSISARLTGTRKAYLVDGVGICGVSGGPVFRMDMRVGYKAVIIVGIISHFHPFQTPRSANDKRQDSYPGLLQIESFDQLGGLVAEIDRLNGVPPQQTVFG